MATLQSFRTFEDVFNAAKREILQRNGRLRKEIVERDGSDVNLIVGAVAGGGDEISGQTQLAVSTLFLSSAVGDDLDRLLYDRYRLIRKSAAPAVGFVEFTTTAANPTAFTIPIGTLLSTSDGIQFSVVQAASFPAASTGPVSVLVQSTLAGLNQQAQIGTITSIVDTITGAPTDLAVTNASATSGAADRENDDSFRSRGVNFFTNAEKATQSAIQNAALGVAGVETAIAFEGTTFEGYPSRYVDLIIADQYTDLLLSTNPTPPTYQAKSQALATLVQAALNGVRAYGIKVNITVAAVVMIQIRLQLSFLPNVDTFAVAQRARGAILTYTNTLPPATTFEVEAAAQVLTRVPGLFITGSEIVSPLGNIVPEHLQVLRTSESLITFGS